MSGGVVLQLALDTLATAGVYALFALAVQAAWSGSGVLHLALGDVAMTGAVVAGALVSDGLSAPLAVAAGLAAGGVVSTAMERVLVRPLGARVAMGAATLVAGGTCLRQALGAGFTRAAYPLPVVPGRWTVAGGVLRGADLVAAGAAAAVAVGAGVALRRSRAGAALRATAASAEAAEAIGVDTRRVRAIAFGLAGMLAVAAAALSAGRVVPAPAAGTAPALKGLAAAVAGGAGAPGLACAAAVVVGAVEVVGSYLWGGAGEVAAAGVAIALVAGRWRR